MILLINHDSRVRSNIEVVIIYIYIYIVYNSIGWLYPTGYIYIYNY